jgi:hypothetical protein
MLEQLAQGETDPALLAALAEPMLRATPEELSDALSAAPEMTTLHRQILRLFLERLELMERQMGVLDRSIAATLQLHQDAVVRLAAVPGLGADSAHQIIAELGPQAATFPSPQELASWVGVCPGREESAEVSKSDESPKGNRRFSIKRPTRLVRPRAAFFRRCTSGGCHDWGITRPSGRLPIDCAESSGSSSTEGSNTSNSETRAIPGARQSVPPD